MHSVVHRHKFEALCIPCWRHLHNGIPVDDQDINTLNTQFQDLNPSCQGVSMSRWHSTYQPPTQGVCTVIVRISFIFWAVWKLCSIQWYFVYTVISSLSDNMPLWFRLIPHLFISSKEAFGTYSYTMMATNHTLWSSLYLLLVSFTFAVCYDRDIWVLNNLCIFVLRSYGLNCALFLCFDF